MITPIFAEPIYQVDNVISEEDNQRIIDECYRLQPITPDGSVGWDCDIYTSFGGEDVSHNKVFESLMKATEQHVLKFQEEARHIYPVQLVNSWFNIAGVGQFQEHHTHPQNWLSAVYYVKSPPGSSGTKFKSIYENHMGEVFPPDTPYHKTYTTKPTERSLIIFPSYLPHYVPTGQNLEDRITVASNWA